VNRLSLDRGAGIAELQALAGSSSETGKLAKFALAQAMASDGKIDDAIALYQELAAMPDPVVSKDSVNIELAKLLEKQGKTQEAADLYFSIASAASQAKDAEGKPIPMSQTARDAKDKLEKLDPERAKQIQEPSPESPFGTVTSQ
jgi:lipopolysaccharide biosynthesis regulator YciM